MSEMVERVARALWDHASQKGQSPAVWDQLEPELKEGTLELAHAAIEAMREPTAHMLKAATSIDPFGQVDPDTAWVEMIDAALKGLPH